MSSPEGAEPVQYLYGTSMPTYMLAVQWEMVENREIFFNRYANLKQRFENIRNGISIATMPSTIALYEMHDSIPLSENGKLVLYGSLGIAAIIGTMASHVGAFISGEGADQEVKFACDKAAELNAPPPLWAANRMRELKDAEVRLERMLKL